MKTSENVKIGDFSCVNENYRTDYCAALLLLFLDYSIYLQVDNRHQRCRCRCLIDYWLFSREKSRGNTILGESIETNNVQSREDTHFFFCIFEKLISFCMWLCGGVSELCLAHAHVHSRRNIYRFYAFRRKSRSVDEPTLILPPPPLSLSLSALSLSVFRLANGWRVQKPEQINAEEWNDFSSLTQLNTRARLFHYNIFASAQALNIILSYRSFIVRCIKYKIVGKCENK